MTGSPKASTRLISKKPGSCLPSWRRSSLNDRYRLQLAVPPMAANRRVSPVAPRPREGPLTELIAGTQPRPQERELMSSRPEDSHLRALPDPYVNLSIHTAPDVRPFPWQSCQWAKSVGFA